MFEAPTAPALPHGWRDVVLGDLGEFSTSSVDKKVNTAELPVRLVNYMDVYRSPYLTSQFDYMQVTASRPEIAKSQVLAGDVLFTPSSETPDDVGHSAVVVEALPDTLHSYHTVRLRIAASEAIDLRFRGRFANSSLVLKHFEKCATGSTRYTLSLADFRSAPVRIPPIAEQAKIAQILDTLDTTIRQTEAIIAKLKQVKQGLLHDLLTRGIDANGELRPPQSEAPHLYKASPLGWIPNEWHVAKLDDVTERGSGHTPSKNVPSYWNGGIKWVSLADSHRLDQIYIHETDKEISALGIANSSAVKHPAGTVVLSRDAGVGKSAVLAAEMAVSQHFMAWRCSADLSNLFLYFVLQCMKPVFESIALGSTVKTIGLSYFKKLQIAAPPRAEQDRAVDILMASEANISNQEAELAKLRLLKSGLMDDLLTGRVLVTPLIPSGESDG